MNLDEPIEIIAAANDSPNPAIVWMPKGKHTINARTIDGTGFNNDIICDEEAFKAVKSSFDELSAAGHRIWIDFDHDDGAAAAWVKDFAWSDRLGIIAHVEWTPRGESALRNKEFHSFSPAFSANRRTGRIGGLLRGHAAGGLVNAPGFGTAMPSLIAARYQEPSFADGIFSSWDRTMLSDAFRFMNAAFEALDPNAENYELQLTATNELYADFKKFLDQC